MKTNREEEMKAVYRFIDTCNIEEIAKILEEIRGCHDNLLTWNKETRLLAKVERVCINGECIQLNIETGKNNEKDK